MRRSFLFLALALCLLASSTAFAQTTGRIEGRATSADGASLPGVTITATSPSNPGESVTHTDESGNFRLVRLLPGTYNVRASLDGFNTLEQQNVAVGVERTVTLVLQMSAAVTDEVIVTSEAPVVDVTSSSAGINLGDDVFENLPVARDLYKVAQIAAGTGSDREGTTIYGGTSVENQYVIDGLNTTGVELGQEGKALNPEFIQEIQVLTGGLSAEYGRLTGGVINAVTKSGGNEFQGDFFGYFRDESLQSDNKTAPKLRRDAFVVAETPEQQDFGFDLGGFLVKDKLWFFLAYDRLEEVEDKTVVNAVQNAAPGTPEPGDVISSDLETDLIAAKLTWRLNDRQRIAASIFADPTTKDGSTLLRRQQISGPPTTFLGVRDTGGTNFTARYEGLFGDSWLVEGTVGQHNEEDKIDGPGKNIPHLLDQTTPGTPVAGGLPFHQDQDFERTVGVASLSKFVGSHEFKLGFDQEDLKADNANWNGGAGQRIYKRSSSGTIYYRHRFYVDINAAGYDPNDSSTWTLAVPLVSQPETTNSSFYVQDSWRITPTFTLNAGARWERQEIGDRNGNTQIDLDDNWAGRLGLIWDVNGNGRSKLFANYGRFFMAIPMDINIRAFGGEVQCFCYNFSPDPADITPDPNAPATSSLLGAGGTPVDPDLGGQYIDEILLGYEYEIRPDFALGVQATYRELGRVVEDFLVVSGGNYFISNPGEGLGTEATFYDIYFDEYPNGDPVTASSHTVPNDGASREYKGLQLTARKRFSDGWQLLANYVWSELEGNYDGAFQVSTGQLDPTINSAFDYADFLVNADGRLSNDRKHQFRVDGSYTWSEGALNGFNIGASAYFKSGYPLNAYGYSQAYNNNELYLVPRGSLGEGPDEYEIDLHFGYPINFSGRYELNLQLDIFNLLDRQSITRVDERFTRPSDGFCEGIDLNICSNMGGIRNQDGSLQPVGSLSNPRTSSPNPDYLTAGSSTINFTGQREFRLGVRFTF